MSTAIARLQRSIVRVLRPPVRLVRWLLTPRPTPSEFRWCQVQQGPAQGCWLQLPVPSEISEAILSGCYETTPLEVVSALVQPGDACLDIGGHYGVFSLAFAARAADGGTVQTFEPVPEHARRIREAAIRSGLRNVTVHQAAVARQSGQLKLKLAVDDERADSMAYLETYGGVDSEAAREHYRNFGELMVDTVRLDDLPEDLQPRLIKIDAEGAEAQILRGATRLIERCRPRLLIEMHGIEEAFACASVLQPLGYRAIRLGPQQTTMMVLWSGEEDREALDAVGRVLGTQPKVIFPSAPENGRE